MRVEIDKNQSNPTDNNRIRLLEPLRLSHLINPFQLLLELATIKHRLLNIIQRIPFLPFQSNQQKKLLLSNNKAARFFVQNHLQPILRIPLSFPNNFYFESNDSNCLFKSFNCFFEFNDALLICSISCSSWVKGESERAAVILFFCFFYWE